MVTSVRLDAKSELALNRLAKLTGKTKSELIREAVEQMASRALRSSGRHQTAYERLADLVGLVDRGPGSVAGRSEEILREAAARQRSSR